jgi:uncharacterized membrane protein YeaQ/YmgE (transglycosylase-associated protein family)
MRNANSVTEADYSSQVGQGPVLSGWPVTGELPVNKSGEGGILWHHSGDRGRAIIGGWLFRFFGAQGVTGLNIYSLIVAVISIYRSPSGLSRYFQAETHLTSLSSKSSSNRRSCREGS